MRLMSIIKSEHRPSETEKPIEVGERFEYREGPLGCVTVRSFFNDGRDIRARVLWDDGAIGEIKVNELKNTEVWRRL